MPEVSGASSPGCSTKFAPSRPSCCIEFSCSLPHLLVELSHIRRWNVALPHQCRRVIFVTKSSAGTTAFSDKPRKFLMETPKYKHALIVGAGAGLSASLTRLFAREGIKVALAARSVEKLGALCTETGARAYACNATDPDEVERLFGLVERESGTPDVVVYNASGRARGSFVDLVPADVAQAIAVSAFGGFLVAQQAAK